MTRIVRTLLRIASLTLAIMCATPALAQQLDPVGEWRIDGFGIPVHLIVEPTADGETYPAYAVFLPPQAATDCVADTNLRLVLCQSLARNGAQVIKAAFELESGGMFGAPAVYAATFYHDRAYASVRLSITPGQGGDTLILVDRWVETQLSRTETAVRVNEKPSPAAEWAEGNWVADLGALRLEASFSPAGPGQLSGSVSAFDTGSRDFGRMPDDVAANWHRVADEFYPFIMTGGAALGDTGAFYGGELVTPREYVEIVQTGAVRLLPLQADVIVAEFTYSGNAGPLDQPFDATPIVFLPLDGPRTSVPPPPPPSSQISGDPGSLVSGEEGGDEAENTDPLTKGDESSGSEESAEVAAPSLVGRWESGPSGMIAGERVGTQTSFDFVVTVPADETEIRIEVDGFPDNRPLHLQNTEKALRYAETLGSLALDGQTVSQWLGGTPALGFSSYERTPPHMLLARGDRGVLIMSTPQADPVTYIDTFGSIPGGRIAFVTRVSGGPVAPNTGEGGPQLIDPPEPPPELIDPLEDPRTEGSEIEVIKLDGAAALVWMANLSAPCEALSGIETGLWAGAADGSVALDDLRALTQIMYAAGTHAGMVNDEECFNVIVMLQAEMARRTPQ